MFIFKVNCLRCLSVHFLRVRTDNLELSGFTIVTVDHGLADGAVGAG